MNKILWADDEIELLKPYVIYLTEKGYQVECATNAQDAITLCKQNAYDIVFMDENMPGLSGLEAISEIKDLQPALPIVMITKSEEEDLMDQAIGEKIADYLIKPVNPRQILLTLKKHIHQKEIVSSHTNASYQQEFSDLSYIINTASTFEEFAAIHRSLTRWDLDLQTVHSGMQELLLTQRQEANRAFAKLIEKQYLNWIQSAPCNANANGKRDTCPTMSHDIIKKTVFPALDNGEKVFFVVIDNFRFDQWKTIQPLLAQYFNVEEEKLACSILPTATAYARNAIFAGLMPQQIKEMFPQFWTEEEDEEGMNLHEQELVQTLLDRFRKRYGFTYFKINESDFCEKVIAKVRHLQTPFNIAVVNFIDMLSHSRTESKMMRELANDEAAYRSLTKSWFEHSPILQLFEEIARRGYKLVLTTDHGTVKVNNAIQVVGDKNTNTNLRYKVGKSLACKSKDVFIMEKPRQYGLPEPNLSSTYLFATGNGFFTYPNNFNYYANYYRSTFQHGGISMEEMLVPLITMSPKA